MLGEAAIIGYSTHNLAQAITAAKMPIDYVAIGPVFSTTSKEDPDAVVGIDGVRRVREVVPNKPLVAIGGITRARAREVFAAGADSIACISELLGSPNLIEERTREFLR
jgi:thiamine-phosphate pyrophosphorylase